MATSKSRGSSSPASTTSAPKPYVLPDRAAFAPFAADTFTYDSSEYTAKKATCDDVGGGAAASKRRLVMFPHQRLIADFLAPTTPYRGLLVYHGLGAGKSCAAIAAVGRGALDGREVVVMLPASLESNFVGEVAKCGDPGTARPDSTLQRPQQPQYVHYNGLNGRILHQLTAQLKRRCVVIIDEVHNFISRAINNPQSIAARLHRLMCESQSIKVIALSGTPFINAPREIAFLVNLVKGFVPFEVYDLPPSLPVPNPAALVAELNASGSVDYVERLDLPKRRLSLRMLPEGFSKAGPSYAKLGARRMEYMQLVPQDPDAFYDTFVDAESGALKNKNVFLRRVQGAVSHFDRPDVDLYPSVRKTETLLLPMSRHQYERYREVRLDEIEREEAAGRNAALQLESSSQVYKTFSRLACNFAFPAGRKRPFPSDLKRQEDDDDRKDAGYETAVQRALAHIVASADTVLKRDLARHSCKFAAMLERIRASPGTALVYSQFRRVEGLALFAEVLKAHGITYAMFAGDGDRHSAAQQTLDVFNSADNRRGELIKVIMITQSGAEGITLKNVRQIHLMEPYWNAIRARQVIGRAIRTCSHADLPPEDRNVDITHYVATIPTAFLKQDAKIRDKDGGLSSDQLVAGIAAKKAAVADEFLELLQDAAVDCRAFRRLMGRSGSGCFDASARGAPPEQVLYSEDIAFDIVDAMEPLAAAAPGARRAVRVDILNVPYLMVDCGAGGGKSPGSELYDYKLYKRGIMKYMGKLKQLDAKRFAIV